MCGFVMGTLFLVLMHLRLTQKALRQPFMFFFSVCVEGKELCFFCTSAVFGGTGNIFLFMFHHSLPAKCVTRIGPVH